MVTPGAVTTLPSVAPLALGLPPELPLDDDDRRRWLDDTYGLVRAWCRRALVPELAILREEATVAEASFVARWSSTGPLAGLVRELRLSALGARLLLAATAPAMWSEIGHAYRTIVGDPERPLVDDALLARLVGMSRDDERLRRQLDDDGRIFRTGALARRQGSLDVSPHLVRRLAALPVERPAPDEGVIAWPCLRPLDELGAPAGPLGALLHELAAPSELPTRLLLVGSAGSGRRNLAAALARRIGRAIGVISCAADSGDATSLGSRLRGVALRGWIPCVTDLDHSASDEVLRVLDEHEGAILLCSSMDDVLRPDCGLTRKTRVIRFLAHETDLPSARN
jgi:hypothetical protein